LIILKEKLKRRQRKNTKIENSTSEGITLRKLKAESLLGKFVILIAKAFFPHDNLLDRHGTH